MLGVTMVSRSTWIQVQLPPALPLLAGWPVPQGHCMCSVGRQSKQQSITSAPEINYVL